MLTLEPQQLTKLVLLLELEQAKIVGFAVGIRVGNDVGAMGVGSRVGAAVGSRLLVLLLELESALLLKYYRRTF